jgi:hypothetical protein
MEKYIYLLNQLFLHNRYGENKMKNKTIKIFGFGAVILLLLTIMPTISADNWVDVFDEPEMEWPEPSGESPEIIEPKDSTEKNEPQIGDRHKLIVVRGDEEEVIWFIWDGEKWVRYISGSYEPGRDPPFIPDEERPNDSDEEDDESAEAEDNGDSEKEDDGDPLAGTGVVITIGGTVVAIGGAPVTGGILIVGGTILWGHEDLEALWKWIKDQYRFDIDAYVDYRIDPRKHSFQPDPGPSHPDWTPYGPRGRSTVWYD